MVDRRSVEIRLSSSGRRVWKTDFGEDFDFNFGCNEISHFCLPSCGVLSADGSQYLIFLLFSQHLWLLTSAFWNILMSFLAPLHI